jgi:Trp operon repressor
VTEKTRRVFDLCLEIDRLETERRELEATLTPDERDDLDDALQIYSDTLGSVA